MSWCVVMMQLPCSRCPQVQSLAPHNITKTTKDFQVVFFVNVLALWCLTRDTPPHGSQRKRSTSLWHCSACAWSILASGMLNVSTEMTAPWFLGHTRKPMTHNQWSRRLGIQGRCFCSPACPVRLRDGVTSAPSLAASAWISRTPSAWPNHRSK